MTINRRELMEGAGHRQRPASQHAVEPRTTVSGNRAFVAPVGDPEEFVRRDGMWLRRGVLTHPSDPQRHLLNPIAMDGRRLIVGEQDSENVLVGTLALAACPGVPTPDHEFDGQVLVYELPPLQ